MSVSKQVLKGMVRDLDKLADGDLADLLTSAQALVNKRANKRPIIGKDATPELAHDWLIFIESSETPTPALTDLQWKATPPASKDVIYRLVQRAQAQDSLMTDELLPRLGHTAHNLDGLTQNSRKLLDVVYQWTPLETIQGVDMDKAVARGGVVVHYVLAIADPKQPDMRIKVEDKAIFPGKADDFIDQAVIRIEALLRRAPMPEDLRSMTIVNGVPMEEMHNAIMALAPYRGKPEYDAQLKRVFDRYIEPHYTRVGDNSHSQSEAYNRFTKGVERTYAAMEKKQSTEAAVNNFKRAKQEE